MENRYEVKLEFKSKKEDIEMILHTMSQAIRTQLFPHITYFRPTITKLDGCDGEQEDTENE